MNRTMAFLLKAGATLIAVLVALLAFAVASSAATVIWVPGTHAEGVPQDFPSAWFPPVAQVDAMAPGATHEVVDYPGTIRPVSGINSPTLGQSVAVGVPVLKEMICTADGTVYVLSLSQGGIVSSIAKYELGLEPNAPPADSVVFITLGNPMRQGSGLLAVLKPFGGIPQPLDIPFYGETVDNQYTSIDVVRQYDAVGHFPKYWYVNPLSALNALAGFAFYHPDYSGVTLDPTDPRNFSYQLGNTTYIMQQEHLPLLIPVRMLLEPFGLKPVIDVVETALKPVIDAGYGPALPPGAVLIPPSTPEVAPAHAAETVQASNVASESVQESADVPSDLPALPQPQLARSTVSTQEPVADSSESPAIQQQPEAVVVPKASQPEAPAVTDAPKAEETDSPSVEHKTVTDTKKPDTDAPKSTKDDESEKPKDKDDDHKSSPASSAPSSGSSASHDTGTSGTSASSESKGASSSSAAA